MAVTIRLLARVARTGALLLGGLGVLALYVLAIWRAPELLVNQDIIAKAAPEQRLPAEHNARLIVISVGGALVVGTGLLYTARNYRLAHRGQVTERFTKALERLGSDELYVRIGGVHALEHVMRDSRDHHGDVVEVLVAFIRDRVPRQVVEQVDEPHWIHPPIGTDLQTVPDEPEPDVQAAITALGRRPNQGKYERAKINLGQLHLKNVRIEGADLRGAHLAEAQLQGAYLQGAQLQHADVTGAQLQGADLQRALLQDADLTGAQLQHADLRTAQLQDADLSWTHLQGAYLVLAQLQKADLTHAELLGARLMGAQLQGAHLVGAQLQGAYLQGAQLQGADLWGAQLEGANLKKAHLQGANLTDAVVTAGQLRVATLSKETVLPEGLVRDPSGEIREKNVRQRPSDADEDQQ